MRNFFIATAILEVATGLLLAIWPSPVAAILLGASITTGLESAMSCLAGVALLSLGVACFLARNAWQGRAARALAGGLLVYNVGAVLVLLYAALGLGMSGALLWPATLLHGALAVWAAALLLRKAPGVLVSIA